jgi:tetratricopeptide (TPR) repeat protein
MAEATGNLRTALDNAVKLLNADPKLAEEQAREILKVVPDQPQTLMLLAAALRAQDDAKGARRALETLARIEPNVATVHYELGSACAAMGDVNAAHTALARAVKIDPNHVAAWRLLGDVCTQAGDRAAADDAYAHQIRASVNDPELQTAAQALCDNRLAVAERLLRDFLFKHPTDVAAMRMLAETGSRIGRMEDAERLLARALELAPGFTAARHNYATVLHRQSKAEAALVQCDLLLKEDPRNPGYRALKAAALVRIGEYDQAIAGYESLLKEHPHQPKAWMSYGHALKTVGRQDESVRVYRHSIALLPSLGEAYWSMANLKTFRFDEAEVAAMTAQLARADIDDEDRYHLDFALGKAFEDAGDYEKSFRHYEAGNRLRRASAKYDPALMDEQVVRTKALYTPDFFRARSSLGAKARDAIFVVGLPRAGSTLIEQILSSHSQVEGTMELPDLQSIALHLEGKRRKPRDSQYPEIVAELEPARFAELGEEYLARARVQRKSGRPFFVDKMPNNFQHLGFLDLILPNAVVIDARRHPLACCFSNYKQHFARGQTFAYDLDDIGRYYRDYVEVMAHFDAVLPGRVHRVFYEDMVADPETEVRRLLAHCGLPFEEACLRFYENERAVRTASSEQVRRPIFTDSVEQWRHYERWLDPLKAALGPVLEAYPGVPGQPCNAAQE